MKPKESLSSEGASQHFDRFGAANRRPQATHLFEIISLFLDLMSIVPIVKGTMMAVVPARPLSLNSPGIRISCRKNYEFSAVSTMA